jgi:hypothetical protein
MTIALKEAQGDNSSLSTPVVGVNYDRKGVYNIDLWSSKQMNKNLLLKPRVKTIDI